MAFNFIAIFKSLTTANINIAGPLLALLVGFQILTDIQFSCPCSVGWNQAISVFIIAVPACLAPVILLLFLELKAAHENSANSQEQDKSGTTQSKETKQSQKTCFVFLVPSVVWLCLCLIDGDYIACAATDWNGKYACDKELHSNCLNWCKPELNQGTNETELYNYTQKAINISKVLGYSLTLLFCILTVFCLKSDCCKPSNCWRGQDTEDPTNEESHNPTCPTASGGENKDPTGSTTSGEIQKPTSLTASGGKNKDSTEPTTSRRQQDPTNHGTMTGSEDPTEKDVFL